MTDTGARRARENGGPDAAAAAATGRRGGRGRTLVAAITAAGLAVALVGCSPAGPATGTGGGSASFAPPSGPSASAASRTAIGLILSIDASSPVDVRSFQLRTDTGQVLTFQVVKGVDTGFPAGHLQEHRASGDPVQVTYHVDGGRNLVDRLADAPTPSGSPGAPSAPSSSGG